MVSFKLASTSKAILTTFLIPLIVLGIVFGKNLIEPKNYSDCVLDSMEGVSSDVAAYAIKNASYKKHARKVTQKVLVYKGGEIVYPYDVTNDEIVKSLRDYYGGTDEDISKALATIEDKTTYVLD